MILNPYYTTKKFLVSWTQQTPQPWWPSNRNFPILLFLCLLMLIVFHSFGGGSWCLSAQQKAVAVSLKVCWRDVSVSIRMHLHRTILAYCIGFKEMRSEFFLFSIGNLFQLSNLSSIFDTINDKLVCESLKNCRSLQTFSAWVEVAEIIFKKEPETKQWRRKNQSHGPKIRPSKFLSNSLGRLIREVEAPRFPPFGLEKRGCHVLRPLFGGRSASHFFSFAGFFGFWYGFFLGTPFWLIEGPTKILWVLVEVVVVGVVRIRMIGAFNIFTIPHV